MKKSKIIPAVAMSTLLLAGCVQNNSTPSSGNLLLDAIEKLEVGQVKKKQVDKFFKSNIVSSGDKLIKKASYREDLFMPYWMVGEGQEEKVYREEVKKSTRTKTYTVYDNEVIKTTEKSKIYEYDPSTINEEKEEDDGIARIPTEIEGTAYIYHSDEDELRYTYTRNGKADNVFSFSDAIDFDNYLFEDVSHKGGLGSLIAQAKEDVEDQFNSFAASVSDWERVEEFDAEKHEDGSFTLKFTGDLCMPLYSAEWVWGCSFDPKDEDREEPIRKKTNDYDNIYVDRRIRTNYEFVINKDGIVTYGKCTYLCYHTSVLEDPYGLYTMAKRNLCYPLTKEMTKNLRKVLVIPDTFGGQDNKYLDPDYEYDEYLPYNVDYFTCSAETNGEFNRDTLPDPTNYRLIEDSVDAGAWINAYDLIIGHL